MATLVTCDMCGRIVETRRKESYYKISCMIQTGYINSDIKHPTFCKDLCLDCANIVKEFVETNSADPLV